MEIIAIAVAVAVAALGLAGLALHRLGSRLDQHTQAFREEMRGVRQETQSAFTAQIGQLAQSFNQQLGDVRGALQTGLAEAGQLSSQAQQTVGQRLTEAAQLVADVRQQLGGLQEAGRDLQSTAHLLESVLSGARTRGSLGEMALDRLLADALPQGSYELQYRFRNGVAVDAAVKMGEKLLPIDSKFPLDSYRRLVEAESTETKEQARKEFARALRNHVDAIADKYILPAEGTLELAFIFLASESIYHDLLLTEDSKGSVADYCRVKHVIPVSPNTLYAYLAVILMGLRGLQVEENTRLLLGKLRGLQVDVESFADVYGRLGTHLKNAQQSYGEAGAKLERLEASVTALAQGTLGEPAALEPSEPKSK